MGTRSPYEANMSDVGREAMCRFKARTGPFQRETAVAGARNGIMDYEAVLASHPWRTLFHALGNALRKDNQ